MDKIIILLIMAVLSFGQMQHIAGAQPLSAEERQLQSIAEPQAGVEEAKQVASLAAPNATIEENKQVASLAMPNETVQEERQIESLATPNATAEEMRQVASLAAPNTTAEENKQIQSLKENISNASYSISVYQNATLGEFLVDQNSTALYYFTKDLPGKNMSNCTGACLQVWMPFYTSALTVAPGLNQSDFTIFTTANGERQIAYKGWPLYHYVKDVSPGDAKGQGINGSWFVIDPRNFHPK